jgi:hypothetical protein
MLKRSACLPGFRVSWMGREARAYHLLILNIIPAPAMPISIARKAQERMRRDEVDVAARLDLALARHWQRHDPLADQRHRDGRARDIVREQARVLQLPVLDGGGLKHGVERVRCDVEG